MERVKPTVRRGVDRTTKPEGLSEDRRDVGARYHCVGTAEEHEKKRCRGKVCVPAGHRVYGRESRPWSRSRRGGGSGGCRTPGASGSGQLVSPRSLEGEDQGRPWTRRIKCRNSPFTQTSWRSAKAGREPPISLVVSVSSGFVRCTSSRIAACSIRSSQAWSRSHQLDGKDSNAQFR